MQKKVDKFGGIYLPEVIWIMVIGIFGRLIPHIPNITPITGLCLFAGANFSRRLSFLIIAIILFTSDVGLALILGYPMISYFTLFTYTGSVIIILVSSQLKYSKRKFPFYIIGASCSFWIWTNFGVWLTSGLYAKTLEGLGVCYYMALPFLRNAIIGDFVWSYLIFGVFYILWSKKMVRSRAFE
jgi:hypothetical protein